MPPLVRRPSRAVPGSAQGSQCSMSSDGKQTVVLFPGDFNLTGDQAIVTLPHISKHNAKEKYSPLHQILLPVVESSAELDGITRLFNKILASPADYKLNEICDINDSLGDIILYRYNAQKVREWLKGKAERVAVVLSKIRHKQEIAQQTKVRNSFYIPDVRDAAGQDTVVDGATVQVLDEDTKSAVEIVCDCLDDIHTDMLIESFGFTSASVLKKHADNKRKLDDWQGRTEIEQETAILNTPCIRPAGAPASTNSGQPTKKPTLAPQSSSTSKKSVNSKTEKHTPAGGQGTKSIASFFMKK